MASLNDVQLAASAYPPLAVGFMGLGTGYLIYFGQELLGWPERDEKVDAATGVWGMWMPGFMQFVTGVYLFVGLAWFHTFRDPALYMAALAFTAYGVHWFAIGYNRYKRHDARPMVGMAFAFLSISILGAVVFFRASDWPVGVLFVLLAMVYISEGPASAHGVIPQRYGQIAERSLGFWHLVTGLWLMYLVWAAALNFASGMHVPL